MTSLTIKSISIQNFGAFKDRQTIELQVQPGRPVVLVKALNGSGKTTLLTALQVGLYGQKAVSTDRKSDYDELLFGLRRRDVDRPAVVELRLLLEAPSGTMELSVRRQWTFNQDSIDEALSVDVVGVDPHRVDLEWDELIQGILPSELMHLFLFDGEKIEALANPEVLPDLLRHATEVFLGIGGVDALLNDLKAVERRSVMRSRDESKEFERVKSVVEDLDGQVRRLDERHAELVQQQAAARNDKEQAQKALSRYSAQAQRRGLAAYQEAEPLREELDAAKQAVQTVRGALAAAMSDQFVPLNWAARLLPAYQLVWDEEQRTALRKKVWQEVKLRDERVMAAMGGQVPASALQVFRTALADDLKQLRVGRSGQATLGDADPKEALRRRRDGVARLRQCLSDYRAARLRLERAERTIGRLPAEEQMSDVLQAMMTHAERVAGADARLNEATRKLEEASGQAAHLRPRLIGAQDRLATEFKDQTLDGRARESGVRTRKALTLFKERLFASKAGWLSTMITAEFQGFLRKRRLIKRVIVDPISYRVSIETARGDELPMGRLSAGERQMLAMSVLSSLIKERRGHFPVVVDTPLARLDREHRSTIVKSFFAKVSHQVLILSTDQEVEGATLDALTPYLSAEYALTYDDVSSCTFVVPRDGAARALEKEA